MLNYNKIEDKVSGMKKQTGITGNKPPKNGKNRSQPDAHRPNAGPDIRLQRDRTTVCQTHQPLIPAAAERKRDILLLQQKRTVHKYIHIPKYRSALLMI